MKMTDSTTSTAYTAFTKYLPDDTVAQISDMISRPWTWQLPNRLPIIHELSSMRVITAPHVSMRKYKPFFGHKFKLGGSKR